MSVMRALIATITILDLGYAYQNDAMVTNNDTTSCRTVADDPCIFPFKFNNVTYSNCTWDYSNTAWCSTSVDVHGIHIGGSKGTCGTGCRIPARPTKRVPMPVLPMKEFFDVLKDIFYKDLGIHGSVVKWWELRFICGYTHDARHAEIRRRVVKSNASGEYRELCEHPAWNGLRDVKAAAVWKSGAIFCKGHRPSQFILKRCVCDGSLDCIDRSDETGCQIKAGLREKFTKSAGLLRQPKVDMSKLGNSGLCGDSLSYNSVFTSRCPSNNSKIPCDEVVRQIRIGDNCYPYHKLCSNMSPDTPEFGHPDHISFCQNTTFWSNTTVKDEKGHLVRNWEDGHGKIYACDGNYPGFNIKWYYSKLRIYKPGCRSHAYCPDGSDRVCPSWYRRCYRSDSFRCSDNKTCIEKGLVCDGTAQCGDASDEDQNYCSECPLRNGGGHPPRLVREEYSNTFSCVHRYTGTNICANPCDGRDDLCQDYADERGCEERLAWWTYLLFAIIAVFIWSSILRIVEVALPSCGTAPDDDSKEQNALKMENNHQMAYGKLRLQNSYGPLLNISIKHEETKGYLPLKEFCRKTYDLELEYNANDENATNAFFFRIIGTNHTASIFFDNIDDGWLLRKKQLFMKTTKIMEIEDMRYFRLTIKTVSYMLTVVAYYLDFFKDIMLAHRLYSFFPDWLPIILFSITVGCITLCELTKMSFVLNFSSWSKPKRVFGSMFIFMVPAVITFQIYRLELQLENTARGDVTQQGKLKKCMQLLEHLKLLSSELRANENVLEHLPQLVILLLLILIKKTETTTVPLHLSMNLVPENEFIIYASATASFLSLVRGQLHLIESKKNGYLPSIGKLFLLAYYIIGTAARVFALLLFFTPILGIFNTVFHNKLGKMGVGAYRVPVYGPVKWRTSVFDIDDNGTEISFGELWHDRYKTDELYHLPSYLLVLIIPIIVAVHMVMNQLIQKKYFRGISRPKASWTKKVLDDLCSFVCPPLHLDWEYFYRVGGTTTGLSIRDCYMRSRNLMAVYNVFLFIEHLVLSIPLLLLKMDLNQRNTYLAKDFPPNEDEQLSTDITTSLVYYSSAGFVALPIVSFLLAHVYFIKWHAWSRILKTQI